MNKDYVPINKSLIPYTFDISLADEIFTLEVKYNSVGDFFTICLYKDGEMLSAGEKVVYGVPLFQDIYRTGEFPALIIVPQAEENDDVTAVTYDNLNNTVYLVVDNGE